MRPAGSITDLGWVVGHLVREAFTARPWPARALAVAVPLLLSVALAAQIVAAVRKNNVPVEYVVFSDEGHGFQSKANRTTAYQSVLTFLDQHANPLGPIIEVNADAVTLSASESANDVEVVPRQHDQVEVSSRLDDPIELSK